MKKLVFILFASLLVINVIGQEVDFQTQLKNEIATRKANEQRLQDQISFIKGNITSYHHQIRTSNWLVIAGAVIAVGGGVLAVTATPEPRDLVYPLSLSGFGGALIITGSITNIDANRHLKHIWKDTPVAIKIPL